MREWHFGTTDGGQGGPISAEDLRDRIRSGAFSADTLVWKNGMSQWTTVSSVPELAAALAARSSSVPSREGAIKPLVDREPWLKPARFRLIGRICAALATLGVLASASLAMFGRSFIDISLQLALAFLVCEAAAAILDRLETIERAREMQTQER